MSPARDKPAETAHEAGHGARHAKSRVAFDVIRADARLKQLHGRVSIGDGPLARAVNAHGILAVLFDGRLQLGRHQVERFLHGSGRQLAVLADQGRLEAVFPVQRHDRVIVLDASESPVYFRVRIALHGPGPVVFDADQEPTSRTAEPARRFLPRQAIERDIDLRGREDDSRKRRLRGRDERPCASRLDACSLPAFLRLERRHQRDASTPFERQ